MRRKTARGVLLAALLSATAFVPVDRAAGQGWSDPVTTTPSFIQKQFGPYGGVLPGEGEEYCGPVATAMGLYYLGHNGYTQLAPSTYTQGNVADEAAAGNLALVIGGLADTSVFGGTRLDKLQTAVQTYFAAKGISAGRFTFSLIGDDIPPEKGPDAKWFRQQLAPNEPVSPSPDQIAFSTLLVSWFAPSAPNTYVYDGGHFVNVAAADDVTGNLTVFNPYPSAFVSSAANVPSSNPQVVGTSYLPADWTLVIDGQSASGLTQYAQIQSGTTLGDLSTTKAIMQFGMGWRVDRSALPTDPGYGIDDWQITSTQVLNTNDGSLDVLAKLTGAGGIAKAGLGTLLLTNDNLLTGSNSLSGGTLASSFAGGTAQAPGTPFGTGSFSGEMSSVLDFRPDDATPRAIHFTLAAGAGSRFQIDAGGTEIHLAKGANSSLTVTVGGNTDGVTPNLVSANRGHAEILVGGGLASLGGTTKLLVAGSGANLPAVTNGMVAPVILGKDNDLNETASFLTYDATVGFLPATPILASAVGINDPGISATTIYRADTSQTVAGAGAAVYALEVSAGRTVSGTGTLAIRPGTGVAGLILNGGTVSAPVAFGAAEAVVLADLQGGTIAAPITGTGGLIKAGRGPLVLTADNAGLSGQIAVNEGRLVAANTAGSATGTATVTLQSAATLQIAAGGRVSGAIDVQSEGILSLAGGTAAGDVTVAAPVGVERGGTIEGYGTVSGIATLSGDIRAGTTAGKLTFDGRADLGGSAFYWRLDDLVDNATSQVATDWNTLSFQGPAELGRAGAPLTIFLEFADGISPQSGNPFWNSHRTWTVFDINAAQWSVNPRAGNFSFAEGQFNFSFSQVNGTVTGLLTFAPVPEPSTCMMALAGLACGGYTMFRRRKQA
ncbi:MAG: PEP-CTERM sorting domain-containing protein [Planctomycetota bacterium]|nr:PEP-CTERM sorting domain-containing protein [Planctomycetota bacterium]